jgi:hypothetical protein
VLELAREEVRRAESVAPAQAAPVALVAGVCGPTAQALREAELARDLGYDVGLVSLGALASASDEALVAHCRAVADVLPVFGFYLQPAVGGRVLGYSFWRQFAEIERVWAVKVAPFNRYQTIEVVRALADAGRKDVALYTGNDDNIVGDLVTPIPVGPGTADEPGVRWFAGGLLGQWAVWTSEAVALLARCHEARERGAVDASLLRDGAALTDANSAIFDAAHGFAGCIAGIHEILRRSGLLHGIWCLDPAETLSAGQLSEINRVCRAYPFLSDDAFVAEHRDAWLR